MERCCEILASAVAVGQRAFRGVVQIFADAIAVWHQVDAFAVLR